MIAVLVLPPLLAWSVVELPEVVSNVAGEIKRDAAQIKEAIWPSPPVRLMLIVGNSQSMGIGTPPSPAVKP